MSDSNIPCIPLPKAQPLKVSLPFGVELKSFVDNSSGPPTDCALIHSLMLQLMPALAGLTCFFKVMNVIGAMKDFFGPPPNLLKAGAVAEAIADVLPCIPLPIQIATMIKDILLLIIAYLKCFIGAVRSILEFQAGIDLSSAEGNPVLLASLQCAQDNAAVSLDQLMQGLQVLEPLLKMIEPLVGMANISLELPSMSDMAGGEPAETLDKIEQVITQLEEAIQLIPV